MAVSPELLLNALESYIKAYVSEEDMPKMTQRSFGLGSNTDSLTEVYRAFSFLKEFDFHPYAQDWWPAEARMQIKIYALKAHIDTLTLDDEATQLFSGFFKEMLPKFPSDINRDNLGNLDLAETYGSYIYDAAIYEKRRAVLEKELFPTPLMGQENPFQLTGDNWGETLEKVTIEEFRVLSTSPLLTEDNWKETLENSLQSNASDPIAQFLIINAIWNNFISIHQDQNDSIVKAFFKALGDQAKNKVHAAAKWLVTAAGHGEFMLESNDSINPVYAQFSTEDLLQFLCDSIFVTTNKPNAYVEQYLKALMDVMNKDQLNRFIHSLENLDKKNIAVISIKFILLEVVSEKKPEFMKLLDPIKLDAAQFFEEVKAADFNGNPMMRNSERFICPPFLMDVQKRNGKAEKEASIIAQASSSRTGLTHFQGEPPQESGSGATRIENSKVFGRRNSH